MTLRDSECGAKAPYTTEALAVNATVALGLAGAPGMRAYLCPWCEFWHVGHGPNDRERSELPPKKAPHRVRRRR